MASGARVRATPRASTGVVPLPDLRSMVSRSEAWPRGPALVPPRRALARMGVHVEFHVRVREHGGADVAAVHDHPARLPHLALARDHVAAHRRMHGDARGGRADLLRPQRGGHVLSVEEHRAARLEVEAQARGQGRHRRRVVEGDARAQGGQRQRAVHGAGVEEDVAEAVRDRSSRRRLARARGPVDRDDEAARPHRRPRGGRLRGGRPLGGRGPERAGRGPGREGRRSSPAGRWLS